MVVPVRGCGKRGAEGMMGRLEEVVRGHGAEGWCRVGVVADGETAGLGLDAEEAECCAVLAQQAEVYGTPDSALRTLKTATAAGLATLKGADTTAEHRSIPSALPTHLLPRIAEFLPLQDVAQLPFVCSAFHHERDDTLYRAVCTRVFPRIPPAATWAARFAAARAERPSGSLRIGTPPQLFVLTGTLELGDTTAAVGRSLGEGAGVAVWRHGRVTVVAVVNGGSVACLLHALAAVAPVTVAPTPPLPHTAPPSSHYRFVVVGAGSVGKSAISVQYIQETFVANYDPSICDTYKKQDIVDGAVCFVEVVDMAGQEEYATMRTQFYRRSDGVLAVYSVEDRNSLEELQNQYREILRERDGIPPPTVLVGNKCDVERGMYGVPGQEGTETAMEMGVPFFEVSAKEKINISAAFHQLVREVRRKREGRDHTPDVPKSTNANTHQSVTVTHAVRHCSSAALTPHITVSVESHIHTHPPRTHRPHRHSSRLKPHKTKKKRKKCVIM